MRLSCYTSTSSTKLNPDGKGLQSAKKIMSNAKELRQNAKDNFAYGLEQVAEAFFDANNGCAFGLALLEDAGFKKALRKAQLKFNDMVDDYIITEDHRTKSQELPLEEGYFILKNAGHDVTVASAKERAMEILGIEEELDFDHMFSLDGIERACFEDGTDIFLSYYTDYLFSHLKYGIPNKDNLAFEVKPNGTVIVSAR